MDIAELYREKQANESYRDKISTVDQAGKRIWLFPKRVKGTFTNYRMLLSYVLLGILFSGPFIKVGGEPLLLVNVFERKFIIFGQIFWPQDFHLFVIGTITTVVFIILFTVVFGRIFCGWICPQTIFMEGVFRQIEYWIEGDYTAQKKLKKQIWNAEKVVKKGSKQLIFIMISALIMHTFMAYLVGIEEMHMIISEGPKAHPAGFIAMLGLTGLFYGVFSKMREQVCTTICPYGRLQGVLLDQDSIVVAYDYARGEHRAKFRKNEDRSASSKGDCIDCHQCVLVCPTGIDIRNGTQLECINCTACIDACDSIMERIDQPKGLIRYTSERSILEEIPFQFTGRMKAYSGVLVVLVGLLVSLLILRSDLETTILRTPGLMYQEREDGQISNLYQLKMVNKTNDPLVVNLKLEDQVGEIEMVGQDILLGAQGIGEGAFFIIMPLNEIRQMSSKISIGVYSKGKKIQTVKTKFLGPAI